MLVIWIFHHSGFYSLARLSIFSKLITILDFCNSYTIPIFCKFPILKYFNFWYLYSFFFDFFFTFFFDFFLAFFLLFFLIFWFCQFYKDFYFRPTMEIYVRRGKKAPLRGAAASVKGSHAKISGLQIPPAAKTHVPCKWEKDAHFRI